MDELAFFCKSFRQDLERCRVLVDSLCRHNRDGAPLYLCVPAGDQRAFADRLGTDRIRYLSDEEVMGKRVSQSWVGQQLVKLRFAGLGCAANYVWIDSDFAILRDFTAQEFFAYPGVPYTVVIEARTDLCAERVLGDSAGDPEYARMLAGVFEAYARVRDWFGRTGPLLFYGAPAIWSSRVIMALEDLARARGLSFEDLLAVAPYELSWYGEFLLATQPIPVVPRGSLSFNFTRDWQWQRFTENGFTLEHLAAAGYWAVNFAAKWMKPVTT